MPLSEDQIDKASKVIDLLLKKGCYVCRGLDWTLYEEFVISPAFDMDYKRPIEGLLLPFIVVICKNCGNSHFFNAKEIGIL